MIENILWVVLAHYIADYPLQGEFLAQTKGKYFYSLLVHSVIYGLTLSLCFKFIGIYALWKVIILIGSHMIIDVMKAQAKNKSKVLTSYLYIDQVLHMSINLILLLI